MILTEYDEQEEREYQRKEGRAEGRAAGLVEGRAEGLAEGRVEGRAEGRVEGRAEGDILRLLTLIRKKHGKGKPLSTIAEELEDSEDALKSLYEQVIKHPDKTPEELLELIQPGI